MSTTTDKPSALSHPIWCIHAADEGIDRPETPEDLTHEDEAYYVDVLGYDSAWIRVELIQPYEIDTDDVYDPGIRLTVHSRSGVGEHADVVMSPADAQRLAAVLLKAPQPIELDRWVSENQVPIP
jgi:hypothetical protein